MVDEYFQAENTRKDQSRVLVDTEMRLLVTQAPNTAKNVRAQALANIHSAFCSRDFE
jgi:hypothetical protein